MLIPRPFARFLFAFLIAALTPAHAQFTIPGPALRLNGFVFAVESDSNGNVYLGGSFNDFNGDVSSGLGLLKLTPGGAKHAAWDIGFIDGVNDLLVHGDFLYVGGNFTTVRTLSQGTLARSHLLRVHLTGPDEGKVDTSWNPAVNGTVRILETDGSSLFLGGSFTQVNGIGRTRLAKLLIGGADPDALDPGWNPAPNNTVADLEHAGGQLYVSGGFSAIGGVSNNYLARLSASGAGDGAWLPEINRPVGDLAASATHLYFGGDFTEVESITHRSVGRYDISAGTPAFDAVWKPDPDGEVSSMALSGSSLYLAGVFTTVGGSPRQFMAKVGSGGTGALDGAFLPQPNGAIQDLKIVGGNLLAAGRFNTTTGAASAGFAMMNPASGAALASFAGVISTEGQIFAMQPSGGGMIIGGLFDSVGGVARTSIARLHSDGSLDTGFNAPIVGFNRLVSDFKLDGSHLYFCGDFLTVGGAPTRHVARVNPASGAVDGSWFTKPLTPILCIETSASHVYIGSTGLRFIEVAPGVGVEVHNLARLSKGAPAMLDESWNPFIVDEFSNPANASVLDLQMSGGNLVIGGRFAFVVNPFNISEAHQRIAAAALSTSGWGQPVAGWGTTFQNINGDIASIRQLLLHNGALYAAGNFVFVNGNVWIGSAKLNATTGAWDPNFDASVASSGTPNPVPGSVRHLAASGDHLYLAGGFDFVWDSVAEAYRSSPDIVRVDQNNGVPDLSWYPYPNDGVSVAAFAGDNLWIHGTFDLLGTTPVAGPAIVQPLSAAYRDWLDTYFQPGQIANSDFTAPWQDLDGDGDPNIVEAFFNTDPFDGRKAYHIAGTGTAGLPLVRRENIGGQHHLTVEFTRWKSSANAGVAATPQFGDNLTTWPRAGEMIGSPVSIGADRERVKYRDPLPDAPRAFGRVEVLPQAP